MPRTCRLVAVSAAAMLIAAATPPAKRAGVVHSNFGPGDTIVFTVPQFIATAVRFKALDETGWDRAGSDEIHMVFANFSPINEDKTSVYEDVDSGETKNFRAADQCIERLDTCERGASQLHFGIGVWERDKPPWPFGDFCHGMVAGSFSLFFDDDPCAGDDFIGRAQIKLSEAELLAALPTVGASMERTVTPAGGAGSYQVTYRITRLPNRDQTLTVNLPTVTTVGISLQATVILMDPKRVRLTWSGANTSTVDIYRDGAKLVTTPNDGTHDDPRMAGTYQYRLCELNSTTACSPTVSATVP